jgi:hypothetical protein
MRRVTVQNLAEVICELDQIIAWAYEHESPLGYFAALYRKVTMKVAEGIQAGFFDDGPRMARLDVVFANRYLEALSLYLQGKTPTRSWLVAFEAAQNPRLIILQHLFLGINAHINLDLGIAAAKIVPSSEMYSLKNDFDKINLILAETEDEVQRAINSVSPGLALLDYIGGRTDERFADFSLNVAREVAWRAALQLAEVASDQLDREIYRLDDLTSSLAQLIVKPGPLTQWVIRIIHWREYKETRRIIQALEEEKCPCHRLSETCKAQKLISD